MLRPVRRGAAWVLLATAALAIALYLAGLVVWAQTPQPPHTFLGLAVVERPGGGLLIVAQLAKLVITRFTPILAFPLEGEGIFSLPLQGES